MKQQGSGRVVTPYNDYFFFWWWIQIIALDEYPYMGIYFRGDPDMSLPPGAVYGAIGNFFLYISFFCIFCIEENKNIFGWCY
jgi:hypothetical protein